MQYFPMRLLNTLRVTHPPASSKFTGKEASTSKHGPSGRLERRPLFNHLGLFNSLGLFSSLGKYRTLVSAVALFVVLDLMVLAMNFVIASGLSENAVAVNLAGRQRMLSQRITKTTLQLESAMQQRRDTTALLAELEAARTLFDTTLRAFDQGGLTFDGQQHKTRLQAVEGPARTEVTQAKALWQPINIVLAQLTRQHPSTLTFAPVLRARTLLETQNLALLHHMNRLTTTLENDARNQANILRAVQTCGIVLALINFCLILFHFVRVLRAADERTDAARGETEEILQTVADGLFLIDRDQRIGSQYSHALKTLLDIEDPAGKSINELLQGRLTPEDIRVAGNYVALLFEPHVNERLAVSLNPLQEVLVKGGRNPEMERYLAFQFKRVIANGKLSHLLVTVNDITARMVLAKTQPYRGEGAQDYLELMTVLSKIDSPSLQECLAQSRHTLDNINQRLRNASRSGMDEMLIASMGRALHTIKGEAACLDLQRLQLCVHDAETELTNLRQQPGIAGDQCLPLLVKIERIFSAIDEIEKLNGHLTQLQQHWRGQHHTLATQIQIPTPIGSLPIATTSNPTAWNDLAALAQRIAQDQGKRIMLHWEPSALEEMPEEYWPWLKQVGTQLIRNAIVHGIETTDVRTSNGKAAVGTLRIQTRREGKDAWVFSVKDDGQGLDVNTIRINALRKGLLGEKEAESYSSVQILSLIFEPGFSTATPDLHAGMGVGLDMVRTIARNLGGRLRVSTRKNTYCEIALVLPHVPRIQVEEKRHASADRG